VTGEQNHVKTEAHIPSEGAYSGFIVGLYPYNNFSLGATEVRNRRGGGVIGEGVEECRLQLYVAKFLNPVLCTVQNKFCLRFLSVAQPLFQ